MVISDLTGYTLWIGTKQRESVRTVQVSSEPVVTNKSSERIMLLSVVNACQPSCLMYGLVALRNLRSRAP